MNIWQFQEKLSQRLSLWAFANFPGGIILGLLRHPFWRGFGLQSTGWAFVNGLIAFSGRASARKRQASLPDALEPERQALEARKLRTLLWVNTGLDVLYVLGGVWLVRSRGSRERSWRGHGWGIIFQGSFLFFFDWLHALWLGRKSQ
jgi:hypothetical protein